MKQPEDHVTQDWVGGETGKRRGAYVGAVKIGCENQLARARTGKSQAEFSRLAGVPERTLRTWERGDPVSAVSVQRICCNLKQHYGPRYFDHYTGMSWSGKGQMPAWLCAELGKGRRLADFDHHAE